MVKRWDQKRTKAVDVKYHAVKDSFRRRVFDILDVPSNYQKANILTKGILKNQFEFLRSALRLV